MRANGQDWEQTGRAGQFRLRIDCDEDIRTSADRIAQTIAPGLRRNELDGIQVDLQELKDSDGSTGDLARFVAPIDSEEDIESVIKRYVHYVASARLNGTLDGVFVRVYELSLAGGEPA